MNFSRRKLQAAVAETLRVCPIESVRPFSLMLAPMYVFMKRNEKFVAVKAPLDFFVPEELERLKAFGFFYVEPFIESVLPYREAALSVKSLLSCNEDLAPETEVHPDKSSVSDLSEIALAPAPYEVSDAVIRVLSPLWSKGLSIEPYFLAVFTQELCAPFSPEQLVAARDQDVLRMEKAILQSSWVVFLALHLGYLDLEYLNRLRVRVFESVMKGIPSDSSTHDLDDLMEIASLSQDPSFTQPIGMEFYREREERVSQKIASRLERVKAELESRGAGNERPSIFGPKGFIDG